MPIITPPFATNFGETICRKVLPHADDPIGGCTLCKPEKIVYIDELDPEDNSTKRLEETYAYRKGGMIKPEAEWAGDGVILTQFFVPLPEDVAGVYGVEMARKLGLLDPQVVNIQVLQPAEGCFVEVKGKVDFAIDVKDLKVPEKRPCSRGSAA